jgi:TetR/AcrR family transcriptional repressor of nem operon
MGVSKAAAAENRKRVIDVAARLFRERGFDGIGINDLMSAAELTRGGFYASFASKEALAVEASSAALSRGVELLAEAGAKVPEAPLEATVEFYLSNRHRDRPGAGCALAALGSDAARHGDALRLIFGSGFEEHISLLETMVKGSTTAERRETAALVMSAMIGALIVSRAVANEADSSFVLEAVKKKLLSNGEVSAPDS